MTIRHEHEQLDLFIPATPEGARGLRLSVQEWLCTVGADAALVDDLVLAVYEALANVVEHAYPPGHPHPLMRLQAQLNQDQALITISDYGCWRDPDGPGHRGRGLAIMRSLVTEVQLNPTSHGTTVRLQALLHGNGDTRASITG